MLEYTCFEKKEKKRLENQCGSAHKQRENITPAHIVLTEHWRANKAAASLPCWSYAEEVIDPPVNLFSRIGTAKKSNPPSIQRVVSLH